MGEKTSSSQATSMTNSTCNRSIAQWIMPSKVRANNGYEVADRCSGQIEWAGEHDLELHQHGWAAHHRPQEDDPQDRFFFRFFRYDSEVKNSTDTISLELGARLPSDGPACTAYVLGGWPFLSSFLSSAVMILIIIRIMSQCRTGRPKKNSIRSIRVVGCKAESVESSTPFRINCRLAAEVVLR